MKLEKINFLRSKLAFSVPTREGLLLTVNDLDQHAGAMRAVFKVNYCIVIRICRIAVNIEGVLLDLANRADPGQFEKESEVVGKVWVFTRDGFAALHVFRLKLAAIRGQNEAGFLLRRRGALPKRIKCRGNFPLTAGLDMNVATLQDATNVRFIRRATLQALDRRRLVAKSFQKGIRERFSLKRLLSQQGYGFFDFDGVHYAGLATLGFY